MTNNTDNSSWAYGILTAADVDQLERWYVTLQTHAALQRYRAKERARKGEQ